MSELSGLDLRRALLERLGWNVRREKVYAESRDYYVLIDPEKQGRVFPAMGYGNLSPEDIAWSYAPAIESDLAAFWPMFEQWCDDTKSITGYKCDRIKTMQTQYDFTIWMDDATASCAAMSSDSLLEAGARAWLSCLERMYETPAD